MEIEIRLEMGEEAVPGLIEAELTRVARASWTDLGNAEHFFLLATDKFKDTIDIFMNDIKEWWKEHKPEE